MTSVRCRNAWVPGLPFSRTLGDELAHQVGVTSEAELTELVLKPHHRVVLLASSSVLELLTSAVRVAPALPRHTCDGVGAREREDAVTLTDGKSATCMGYELWAGGDGNGSGGEGRGGRLPRTVEASERGGGERWCGGGSGIGSHCMRSAALARRGTRGGDSIGGNPSFQVVLTGVVEQ